MYCKPSLGSAALLLLTLIALVTPERLASHVNAHRPASNGSNKGKTVTVLIRAFKFDPATVTVREDDIVE